MAVCDGIITKTGENSLNGKYLIFTHDSAEIIYAHLSEILVKENDKITKGQVVAKSGNTGISSGPHLHYGIKENGDYIDPYNFVDLTLTKEARNEIVMRGEGLY